MPIYLYNSKPLVVDSKLAVSEDCCCGGGRSYPCNSCVGTPPSAFAVTFSGITNGTCSNCGRLNNTFIANAVTGCEWEYLYEDGPWEMCGLSFRITVDIYDGWISVGLGIWGEDGVFAAELNASGDAYDCNDIPSLPLWPGYWVTGYCNGTPSCTVSPL